MGNKKGFKSSSHDLKPVSAVKTDQQMTYL